MASAIQAIIFDLGGVILNLDQDRTFRAFARLGADLDQVNACSSVFNDFETGRIGAGDFRLQLCKCINRELLDADLDSAWNAMLLDLPAARIDMIERLRKRLRVYLLSNTNSIHIDSFYQNMPAHMTVERWRGLFDKIYYSYEIGLRKPNADIYEHVLKDTGHAPEACLFIDDSKVNLQGAASVGIRTLHAARPLDDNMMEQIKAIALGRA